MKNFNLKTKNHTSKGITLIALVITIIVMLILAAVSITMAVNGGLFSYAQNASAETENAKAGEQKLASGIIGGQRIEDLVTGGTSLLPGEVIPAGGIYLRVSSNEAYYSNITDEQKTIANRILTQFQGTEVDIDDDFDLKGETVPNGLVAFDAYYYGDYVYIYGYQNADMNLSDGWWAIAFLCDNTKTSYGEVLNSINGGDLKYLVATFSQCENLIEAPKIPNTVIDMSNAFINCYSLEKAPVIPNGVLDMEGTFECCYKLATAPVIPDSVDNMIQTFWSCDELTGIVTINSNPTDFANCFHDTKKQIYLTGSSTILADFADTATNDNITYKINEK